MEAAWIETFYQETDAPKRLELLKQNTENELTQADMFRKKLWVARYGKRKPTKDAFVGSLMELKCLAEGTSLDFGGQRKKKNRRLRLLVHYVWQTQIFWTKKQKRFFYWN